MGTYNLSGSGQLSSLSEAIGYSGTGVFTQSGGTNSASLLYIAALSGSNGTYNLNGGTLALDYLAIGSGTGAFNFNGGTLTAANSFLAALPIRLGTAGSNATFDTDAYQVGFSGLLTGPGNLFEDGHRHAYPLGRGHLFGTDNHNRGHARAGRGRPKAGAHCRRSGHPGRRTGPGLQRRRQPAPAVLAILKSSYVYGFASGQIYSSTAAASGLMLGWSDNGTSP